MNQQLAIAYPADYVGDQAWQRQLEAIRAAVVHLRAKEVAFVLDVGATHLSDALHERDRKVWHGRWTHVIKAMLAAQHGDDVAAEILRQIVDADVAATPFAITDEVTLTPEQEALALRRELAKFGDAGKAAIARARGGRR